MQRLAKLASPTTTSVLSSDDFDRFALTVDHSFTTVLDITAQSPRSKWPNYFPNANDGEFETFCPKVSKEISCGLLLENANPRMEKWNVGLNA
jgi:hypothetical protein